MKSKKIFWGILLIALAGLLLLDAFGVWEPLAEKIGKISIWALICGAVLLLYIIRSLIHWKISRIFVPFALLFMLFEENIAVVCGLSKMNIINNWILLLVAVLLTVGFALHAAAAQDVTVEVRLDGVLVHSQPLAQDGVYDK